MVKVPSLVSLSIDVVKRELLHGDDFIPHIYELPPELFNSLVKCLPPSTLQKLQTEMPFKTYDDYESTSDYIKSSRKRGRSGNFNKAWKELFTLRWPDLVDRMEPDDWQQIYWETHVQNCLDEAAELALLPSFGGCLGEIQISEKILRYIGYVDHMGNAASDYLKLSYHCQHFGYYARCLRLQNVLCVVESCGNGFRIDIGFMSEELDNRSVMSVFMHRCASLKEKTTFEELQVTKLGCTVDPICGTCINISTFEFHRIEVMDHLFADGLCKLLSQNCKTLTSLKFIHCKLSSTFVDAICESLSLRGAETHQIQHFSISSSSFLEPDPVNSAHRLASFLSSGRSLRSLKLCNNHLDWNFARRVLSTLLDASSSISILDLSENNITGWLLNFNWRSSALLSSLGVAQSLQSLRVLNLRGNNLQKDDASNLKYALVQMPNLETLDLSDNPIEDDGIRCLIPYIAEASKTFSPLAHLNLENCELSHDGVTQLLNALSTLRKPLNSLSIADNGLGSQVAEALRNFWSTSIQVFNLEGIGLGPSGFRKLQDVIMEDLMLVEINISKNRGGIETSKFLSKLIQQAPKLIAVNAAYNLMPVESLTFICSALKTARGHLKQVDLTGNIWDYQPSHDAMLSEFQYNGKPILILPSSVASNVHYDDDP
ncbi:Leucine-rich repeat, ribonuclease inhibitor subtype [Corchorus capsularis]|uniref:Leucine-rich repeat, ribonuclease inhibitor subtype n=1 Tax=Corchorus capsularis TaxID=210143 RepID=A0A1R3JSK7_COCAP|nr:Leucine-rich repeat, ribonuclease inhibitor subtype [Corchorus capsularis]